MKKGNGIQKVLGYILLFPSVLSVFIFVAQLFNEDSLLQQFKYSIWTGYLDLGFSKFEGQRGGGGFTSALPFYFGLMAIAGAYLIKDSNKIEVKRNEENQMNSETKE